MKIQSARFGEVEIDESKVIEFPEGLLGFSSYKKFGLLPSDPSGAFLLLQCLEDAQLAFVVTDPRLWFPNYRVELSSDERDRIGLREEADLQVLVIVNRRAVKEPDEDEERIELENALWPQTVLLGSETGTGKVLLTANLAGPVVIHPGSRLGLQIVLRRDDFGFGHFGSEWTEILGQPQVGTYSRLVRHSESGDIRRESGAGALVHDSVSLACVLFWDAGGGEQARHRLKWFDTRSNGLGSKRFDFRYAMHAADAVTALTPTHFRATRTVAVPGTELYLSCGERFDAHGDGLGSFLLSHDPSGRVISQHAIPRIWTQKPELAVHPESRLAAVTIESAMPWIFSISETGDIRLCCETWWHDPSQRQRVVGQMAQLVKPMAHGISQVAWGADDQLILLSSGGGVTAVPIDVHAALRTESPQRLGVDANWYGPERRLVDEGGRRGAISAISRNGAWLIRASGTNVVEQWSLLSRSMMRKLTARGAIDVRDAIAVGENGRVAIASQIQGAVGREEFDFTVDADDPRALHEPGCVEAWSMDSNAPSYSALSGSAVQSVALTGASESLTFATAAGRICGERTIHARFAASVFGSRQLRSAGSGHELVLSSGGALSIVDYSVEARNLTMAPLGWPSNAPRVHGPVWSNLLVSDCGRWIAVLAVEEQRITVFDAVSRLPIASRRIVTCLGSRVPTFIQCKWAFSGDGASIEYSTFPSVALRWHFQSDTLEQIEKLPVEKEQLEVFAYSGGNALMRGRGDDGIERWIVRQTSTGAEVASIALPESVARPVRKGIHRYLTLSPCGKRLVVSEVDEEGDDAGPQVLVDLRTGRCVRESGSGVRFTRCGEWMVIRTAPSVTVLGRRPSVREDWQEFRLVHCGSRVGGQFRTNGLELTLTGHFGGIEVPVDHVLHACLSLNLTGGMPASGRFAAIVHHSTDVPSGDAANPYLQSDCLVIHSAAPLHERYHEYQRRMRDYQAALQLLTESCPDWSSRASQRDGSPGGELANDQRWRSLDSVARMAAQFEARSQVAAMQ